MAAHPPDKEEYSLFSELNSLTFRTCTFELTEPTIYRMLPKLFEKSCCMQFCFAFLLSVWIEDQSLILQRQLHRPCRVFECLQPGKAQICLILHYNMKLALCVLVLTTTRR